VERLPSNRPNKRILAMLGKAEPVALFVVIATTVLILALWFSPRLAALAPPIWDKMVPNTAIGMACAAASLALSMERRSPLLLRLSQATGFAALALGVLTLAEYAADVSLGIDTWLPTNPPSRYPGRPSPQTALGFALLGTSLLAIRESKNRRSLLADVSAVAACRVLPRSDRRPRSTARWRGRDRRLAVRAAVAGARVRRR
jgi:hypothetical protein